MELYIVELCVPNCITVNVTMGSNVASGKMLLSDRQISLSEEQHDEPEKHVSTSSTTERELLEVVRPRYLKASKVEKQKILDEFTFATGYIRNMRSGF